MTLILSPACSWWYYTTIYSCNLVITICHLSNHSMVRYLEKPQWLTVWQADFCPESLISKLTLQETFLDCIRNWILAVRIPLTLDESIEREYYLNYEYRSITSAAFFNRSLHCVHYPLLLQSNAWWNHQNILGVKATEPWQV